jgi:hypothetical protein
MHSLQNKLRLYPQTAEQPLLSNHDALEMLAQRRNYLTALCYSVGVLLVISTTLSVLTVTLGSIPSLGFLGIRLQKTSQILLNMERLLNEFESQGVILTPELAVPENGTLDLFMRFPNPPKVNFAIGFRSNGNSKVSYNSAKETLYRRRKNGGLKPWDVDLFRRIGLQEFWLRKNRKDLFGQSSKDKNRSVVKLLVLTGETRLGSHPEEMYVSVGDQRVLFIQKRVSVYLMEENQLIPFIRAWLAQSNPQ